jgi:predicted TIM-barrel fold metal-dependent hydrolase
MIDSDTHVTEAPDLWTSRAPAALKHKFPHVVRNAQGALAWVMGEEREPIANIGMTAVAGIEGGINSQPNDYSAMHPGATDAKERLKYMDQIGMWAMVLYPNVGGFGAQTFLRQVDADLKLACVQIYNDWMTEWASADLRRLLPNTSIPIWDVAASVKEIRRCHAMGHKGILFSGSPESLGMPRLSDPHWDPIWEVACELDTPINFHIGSGDMGEDELRAKCTAEGFQPAMVAAVLDFCLRNGTYLSNLIMSGILIRYPTIKFVSVESGIGWIPFVLEQLDYQFEGNEVRKYFPKFEMLPSEYFRRNIYACYWYEKVAPQRLLHAIGVDNIMFETDFPHPTSIYGKDVAARVEESLSGVDPVIRHKILFGNAQKLYKLSLPTAADEARRKKAMVDAAPFWHSKRDAAVHASGLQGKVAS